MTLNFYLMIHTTGVSVNYYPGLVSIGVPTFNRPYQLRRALECLLGQTYKNIELIISDNASTTSEIEEIAKEFAGRDSRVQYIRQKTNIGAHANFSYLLKQANGEYFMWAADDDIWSPWFIEKCVNKLICTPDVAAAMTETQYFGVNGQYPFFPEGIAFYQYMKRSGYSAIAYVLDNNYGNLIYSLFRKAALMKNGNFFWEEAGMLSLNEIPAFLYVATSGGFIVLPEIGFYKCVPTSVYEQARWEMRGGRSPVQSRIRDWNSAFQTWIYHKKALEDIQSAINLLSIDKKCNRKLIRKVQWNLFKHFFWMLIGWKPVSVRGD